MITIYHLGVSQSDRIVWLMEELGLPYDLQWFDRGEDMLAPQALRDIHPASMAPVIKDGDLVLAESAAICEYISQTHADGKLSVKPGEDGYADYLYWMQFNNNIQCGFFVSMAVQAAGADPKDESNMLVKTSKRRADGLLNQLNDHLGKNDYLAGGRFSCADVMAMFSLTSLALFGGPTVDHLPNVMAYVERISARPAYQKAMELAGPAAPSPNA